MVFVGFDVLLFVIFDGFGCFIVCVWFWMILGVIGVLRAARFGVGVRREFDGF